MLFLWHSVFISTEIDSDYIKLQYICTFLIWRDFFKDLYVICVLIIPCSNIPSSSRMVSFPFISHKKKKNGLWEISWTQMVEWLTWKPKQPDLLLFHWLLFATAHNVYLTKIGSPYPSQSVMLIVKLKIFTVLVTQPQTLGLWHISKYSLRVNLIQVLFYWHWSLDPHSFLLLWMKIVTQLTLLVIANVLVCFRIIWGCLLKMQNVNSHLTPVLPNRNITAAFSTASWVLKNPGSRERSSCSFT